MIEHVKTAVLWLMIMASIVLTWFVWTYQPAYEELTEEDSSYIEVEDIGETKSFTEVLYPSKVIEHDEEEQAWVHPAGDNYSEMMSGMQEIELEAMYSVGSSHAPGGNLSFTGIEFLFDEALKAEWIPFLFEIEEEEVLINNIDRIVLALSEREGVSDVVVRFIDMDEEEVFESETSLSLAQLESFSEGVITERTEVVPRVFQEDDDSIFQPVTYVPDEPMNKQVYTYETTDISPEGFIQTLFTDPEYVRQYFEEGEDSSYTDGTRMMDMTEGGSILNYVQPDVSGTPGVSDETVVRSSQEFINSHYGWTDDFYATGWREGEATDSAEFTLHVEGMPVFEASTGQSGHYQLEAIRSGTEIIEYTRPMFQLDETPFEIDTSVELPGYSELERYIEEEEAFSPDIVEDARIAFYMSRQNSLVVFEPSWFVYTRGQWHRVATSEMTEQEVPSNGLE
ncbi:MAG: hypothetical protein EA344_07765 [Alkalicoccus sp.]|nr:MAG: hypothetical protein EA344_07765 [Alkalicoccus sp.]